MRHTYITAKLTRKCTTEKMQALGNLAVVYDTFEKAGP